MKLVTVLGGYGIFGRRVAEGLQKGTEVAVRIAGRNKVTGQRLAQRTGVEFRGCDVQDRSSLIQAIEGSAVVVHAAGPFQRGDYAVAQECIRMGVHYIDMADARNFVTGVGSLDVQAKENNVFVTSGASSVPAISYAMVEALKPEFELIERIKIALSPGNQNPRGASTISAILSYVGRPIPVWENGVWKECMGWGDPCWLEFPLPVGRRRVHDCDVPDLQLFPKKWKAQTVHFQAGVELNILNYTLSGLATLVRKFSWQNLPHYGRFFGRISRLLFFLGSKNGSLAVWVDGKGPGGEPITRKLGIVTDDDGPATPSSPSVILTKKILEKGPPCVGAFPCMGFVNLAELMTYLRPLGIWCVRGDENGWKSRT